MLPWLFCLIGLFPLSWTLGVGIGWGGTRAPHLNAWAGISHSPLAPQDPILPTNSSATPLKISTYNWDPTKPGAGHKIMPPHPTEEKQWRKKQVRFDVDEELGSDPMLPPVLTLFIVESIGQRVRWHSKLLNSSGFPPTWEEPSWRSSPNPPLLSQDPNQGQKEDWISAQSEELALVQRRRLLTLPWFTLSWVDESSPPHLEESILAGEHTPGNPIGPYLLWVPAGDCLSLPDSGGGTISMQNWGHCADVPTTGLAQVLRPIWLLSTDWGALSNATLFNWPVSNYTAPKTHRWILN